MRDEIGTVADAVTWIISRLDISAALAGDPLAMSERARLAASAADVDHTRSFERWVQRRKRTLHEAIAADAPDLEARERWTRAVRMVGEATPVPVLALLISAEPAR